MGYSWDVKVKYAFRRLNMLVRFFFLNMLKYACSQGPPGVMCIWDDRYFEKPVSLSILSNQNYFYSCMMF